MARVRKSEESEEGGGGGETKGKRNLRGWEGQLGKAVAISFLGKSPDSCSVNARPLHPVRNRKDDGQRRSVLKFETLLSSKGWGMVRDWDIGQFWRFFANFREEKLKGFEKFIAVSCSARMVGERKEFRRHRPPLRRCCLLPFCHRFGITRSKSTRHPRQVFDSDISSESTGMVAVRLNSPAQGITRVGALPTLRKGKH